MRQWKAEMLGSRGRLDLAAAEYEALLRENPAMPGVHKALGVLYGRAGDWERALDQFRQELVLSPEDNASLEGVTECLLHMGKLEEAASYLKPIVTRRPTPKWALMDLATVEEHSGDLESAIEQVRIVIRQDPRDQIAHYRLIGLYNRIKRTDLAEKEAAEFHRLQGLAHESDDHQ